ncbi:TPA: phosphatase PAP2 family protein [Streptococcus pneumoniae]|nr:phosphatase PAP2 family protein [Streptococcus pneumoniae]
MQAKLIGYQHRDTVIHRLSGAGKLLFFILVSLAAMISYDTRMLLLIAIFSVFLLYLSEIRFKDVSFVAVFATVFAVLNVLMVYLFSPEYGVGLYGERSVIWQGIGVYTLTSQELFYLLNLAIKYLCTIPLAIIFLMTTHPMVEEKGFSFPSGHSLAVTLMVGTLIVILSQRIKNPVWRKIVQIVLGLYLVSVLVSRVYLGVHYPSDVFASLCVGLGVLFIEFPFYDKLRFQWRFKGKQK